jgi:hypothetical protein
MDKTGVVCVKHNEKVVLKITSRCGGEKTKELGMRIATFGKIPTLKEVMHLCQIVRFGCSECLIAMNRTRKYHAQAVYVPKSMRSRFSDPMHYPFSKNELPDESFVVNL